MQTFKVVRAEPPEIMLRDELIRSNKDCMRKSDDLIKHQQVLLIEQKKLIRLLEYKIEELRKALE